MLFIATHVKPQPVSVGWFGSVLIPVLVVIDAKINLLLPGVMDAVATEVADESLKSAVRFVTAIAI